MGTINLSNIRLFAYHGCLDEEAVVGSEYRVDLEVRALLERASETDRLSDTVDYVLLYSLVKEEMETRSKLLEHVASRIIKRILAEVPLVREVEVRVAKINPPIGGEVEAVSVTLKSGLA